LNRQKDKRQNACPGARRATRCRRPGILGKTIKKAFKNYFAIIILSSKAFIRWSLFIRWKFFLSVCVQLFDCGLAAL